MRHILFTLALSLGLASAYGQEVQTTEDAKKAVKDDEKKGKQKKEEKLSLENLFPEKGLFGPSARSMAFSDDGKFAAYLYRPYIERRHGNDLWIFDAAKGETRRITSVSVLAEFQEKTREVSKDRVKKAKKAAEKKSGKEKTEEKKGAEDSKDEKKTEEKKDSEDEKKLGDTVGEDDAEDKKAPRYSGVSTFKWSPLGHDLLFVSQGDIYRYELSGKKITRLTATRGSESSVAWLPDGKGYTYRRDSVVYRVRFGCHLIEQLDPKLGSGETMSGYRISPDGKRMAITASKGQRSSEAGRKVSIATYRDRFTKVREVPRHVSDDPLPKRETILYLCELGNTLTEKAELVEVHRHESTGPRDIFRGPEWSEDSERAAFSVFLQKDGQVTIYEATFAKEDEKKETKKDSSDQEKKDAEKEDSAKEKKGEKEDKDKDAEKKDEKKKRATARPVYRFFHNGGPNTPSMIRPQYLADNRRIAFLSEQSGYRHLYVLDPLYESVDQLTRGRYEVYPVDLSKDRKTMFVTATKEDPARQRIYAIDLESGAMRELSPEKGVYSEAAVSPDGKHALATFSTFGRLKELVAITPAKPGLVALTDSHPEKAHRWTKAVPEFFAYENRHGHEIHGQLFKPDGWTKTDKRPLLIYVYGGPLGTRKMVTDGSYSADSYFFAWYMAKKHGYLTCTIDPRGVSGYGALFEKANYEQVGKPQVEDLVDGAKHLIASYGVDPDRVGIHGWSFGGFQTQMCLYTAPEVFKAGMAGAGPTEWENYNSWYSQGTIGETGVGTADLKKYSLLPLAKKLEGQLLLVHGMEDSNVLYQDTVRVYRELLKAGKETNVELFLDPTGGHGLGGDVKRLNRARKYEEFLLRNLGKGAVAGKKPAKAPAKKADTPATGSEKKTKKVKMEKAA